jgi:phosphatidylglycerol:prolipoprotein diacylglycerol transferase
MIGTLAHLSLPTPTLGAWLHTLDPFLVRFTDTFGIRWYGLSYVTGFVIAYFLLTWMSRHRLIALPVERVYDAMLWLVFATLLGGRLGYAVFYDRPMLTTFSSSFPYWSFLAINTGGMASHGAMIGLCLACVRISRGWKDDLDKAHGRSSILHVMDYVALVAPFGVFLGRIANFINGELLGAVVSPPGTPGPWWTVQYPQEILLLTSSHTAAQAPQTPEQARELDRLAAQAAPNATLNDAYHLLVETSATYADALRPLISSRHPSQLYQAFAEGIVVATVLWFIWRKPRSPGVIAAWFFLVYGILRITTELWRLPDAQLAVQRFYGLSRGQWLSVGMLVFALGLFVWIWKHPLPKVGGWARRFGTPDLMPSR